MAPGHENLGMGHGPLVPGHENLGMGHGPLAPGHENLGMGHVQAWFTPVHYGQSGVHQCTTGNQVYTAVHYGQSGVHQ